MEGQEADARTGIFVFGAVVYEMVTGKRAFEGKRQASLIAWILERDPAPMSSPQPVVPASLGRIVRACLGKNADDRWQTAWDLLRERRWPPTRPPVAPTAPAPASAAAIGPAATSGPDSRDGECSDADEPAQDSANGRHNLV